jgi:hypothetical protein
MERTTTDGDGQGERVDDTDDDEEEGDEHDVGACGEFLHVDVVRWSVNTIFLILSSQL